MRVLLAVDDFYSNLAAVRALRAAGYEPWLAVDRSGTYAARSRAAVGIVRVPDPAFDREGFARELADAARRLSVAAVLPGAETHLLTLAGREADFAGIAFGVPPREKVERAIDKNLLPELADAAGLRTPPTLEAAFDDGDVLEKFGFPAIVKPRRSRLRAPDGTFSPSSRRVSTRREAEGILEALPGGRGLLQPNIPGALAGVSGVAWEGEIVCAVHQLSSRIWPMPAGVSSYARTVPPDPKLERGVGRLLREIGWSGIFQVQFLRDRLGENYLIDLNPRIYGSLALAVAAGLNLPSIWTDLLLGRRPDVGEYRVGVRYRQEETDALAMARTLMDGEYLCAIRGLMPRRDTTHAVFSLLDPMPSVTSAMNLLGYLSHVPAAVVRRYRKTGSRRPRIL